LHDEDAEDAARRGTIVRRIAMSDCFSFTTITSVETTLKAATPMISSRITNRMPW